MGSKAAIVVLVDGDPREVFRGDLPLDRAKSRLMAEEVLGGAVKEVRAEPLDAAIWPAGEVVCAAAFPRFDIICSKVFAESRPSRLTERILRLARGRDAYCVFMHSAEDRAAFAVWSGNQLVRAVSVSPDSGVVENLGERLPFEEPFWAGRHPVFQDLNYPLPFHPIDLGNEALRAFFGFILEGREDSSCVDPEEIDLLAFRLANE